MLRVAILRGSPKRLAPQDDDRGCGRGEAAASFAP
jgi:hypothetical protein